MVKISASILSADFGNLALEISKLEKAGADLLHLDVMDGLFVPNLTLGFPVIKSLRPLSNLPFDAHLMINSPENYIKNYADAGADIITFHPEASKDPANTLNSIKSYGKKAGIALLPSSSPDIIDSFSDNIDLVLVMSVNPGFGGQEFMPSILPKIKILKEKIKKSGKNILISVDGGINEDTAKPCLSAGADILVSGSFIFAGDYMDRIEKLRNNQGALW